MKFRVSRLAEVIFHIPVLLAGLSWLFISSAPAGEKEWSSATALSLKDAVSLAFRTDKDILIQREEVRKAEAAVGEARSGLLPKLTLRGGYVHNDAVMELPSQITADMDKDPGVFLGYINEERLGIGLEQPLFEGGEVLAGFKRARLHLRFQEEALRARKLAVEFEVKRLYYGLLLAGETERISRELVEQARSHYADVEKKFQEGTSSRFDLIQSRVQVSKVTPQLVRARNARELIASELGILLGIGLDRPPRLTDSLAIAPIEIEEGEFLRRARRHRPELVMKALGMDMEKQGITAARAGYLPRIEASFNYDYRTGDLGEMFTPRHNLWSAGIAFRIPLFDGLSAMSKVAEARARYQQAILDKADLEDQITLEIRRACLDLVQAETIVESQRSGVEEAREALRIAETSYASGVGTNLDVLDAQVSLSQIENNLSGAIYDYLMAQAYLDRSLGKSSLEEEDENQK